MFDFGFHFNSIYFCFILFWSGQVEVQIKAHPRVPFNYSYLADSLQQTAIQGRKPWQQQHLDPREVQLWTGRDCLGSLCLCDTRALGEFRSLQERRKPGTCSDRLNQSWLALFFLSDLLPINKVTEVKFHGNQSTEILSWTAWLARPQNQNIIS